MNFISTFNQILVMCIMILIGFLANKRKIITNSIDTELSNLILYVLLPALIIKSMQYEFSQEIMKNSMKMLGMSLGIYAIIIGFSFLAVRILRLEGKQRDILQYMLIFSNVGFMGYPIISFVYGDIGVFYTALFNMPFNLLTWTVGVTIMSRSSDSKEKFSLKRVLFNPGLAAIVVGYTLFLTSTKVPESIYNVLNMLGSATTPMSMIVIGSILSKSNMGQLFTNIKLNIIAVFRLLVNPLVVFLLLKFIVGMDGMLLGIPTIIIGMPVAANCAIFATKFENDKFLASQGVFVTTLLSLLTIPVVIAIAS